MDMSCSAANLHWLTLSWWLALLSSIEIRIFHFAASPDTCTWITFTTAARWELSLALPSKLTTISEPSIAFLDIFATLSRSQDTSCPHLVEFLGRKCSDSLALLNNSCFAKHSTQDHSTIRSCDGCAKNLGRDNFSFPSISILLVLARVRHHTSEESDQIANSVPPKLIEFLWSIGEHPRSIVCPVASIWTAKKSWDRGWLNKHDCSVLLFARLLLACLLALR